MLEVPHAIRDYASKFQVPVALVGCRSAGRGMDCCEYDLIVYSSKELPPTLNVIEKFTIELFHSKVVPSFMAELRPDQMLNPDLGYSAPSVESNQRLAKILHAEGRRSLAKCLMLQKMSRDSDKNPTISAVCLKAAAYCYTRGLLQISGSRPMPLHELQQLRELAQNRNFTAELDAGLDAMGLDYATRHLISRTKRAASELLAGRYDKMLILEKVDALQKIQKLADAHYYLGRVICDLIDLNGSIILAYPKILQRALGISNEPNQTHNLGLRLFRAAAAALKT